MRVSGGGRTASAPPLISDTTSSLPSWPLPLRGTCVRPVASSACRGGRGRAAAVVGDAAREPSHSRRRNRAGLARDSGTAAALEQSLSRHGAVACPSSLPTPWRTQRREGEALAPAARPPSISVPVPFPHFLEGFASRARDWSCAWG